MTNQEALKILEGHVLFADIKNPLGRHVYEEELTDEQRDRTNCLYCPDADDNGFYVYVLLRPSQYCRFEGHYYEPELLEAIACWMRDPHGVVNAK
jgi:hypothetical protein